MGKAAYEGRTEDLIALLEGRGAAPDAPAGAGSEFGALVWAARGGQTATIRALLSRSADPNAPAGVNGWSPIQHAIHKERRAAVEALLDGGADVNFRANHGVTPLLLAAGQGEEEIVAILLARGADPRAETDDGSTALSNAVAAGSLPIERRLLEKAPDLTLKHSFFNSVALVVARLRGRGEIVALVEGRRS